jgi:hypothetical protein
MLTQIFSRPVIASMLILGSVASTSSAPKVIPLRTSATFSAQSPEKRWSAPIKSADGSAAYVLSLEPDFDVGHHIVSLDLVLRHPADKPEDANLLDPTGKVHSLQPYDFVANDLAEGVRKSAFGAKRAVTLNRLGLVVRMNVLKATVVPTSTGNHEFDTLEVQIEVDNASFR